MTHDTTNPPVKRCLKCKNEKPHSLFYKSTRSQDNLRPYCKACMKKDREDLSHREKPFVLSKICHKCKIEKPRCEFCNHRFTPDGLNGECKDCVDIYQTENRERMAIKAKETWTRNNPPKIYVAPTEKVCTVCKQTKDIDLFHLRKNTRDKRTSHCKDCARVRARRAYPQRASAMLLYNRNYRKRHPERCKMWVVDRRIRKINAPGSGITIRDIENMRAIQSHRCAYCWCDMRMVTETIDHIVPLISGGAHDPANCCLCCKSCNSQKSDTPLEIWLAKRS